MAGLQPDAFDAMVPLLRRAFSAFTAAERRSMGELVRALRGGGPGPRRRAADPGIDEDRAGRVMPVLAHVLGVEP